LLANAGGDPLESRDIRRVVFSVLMGCGSMNMGQAIGKRNPRGEYPVDRSAGPQDVAATVFHHLGIDSRKVTFADAQGRPVALIETGKPIRELVRS
jgi:hypothetical protein